MNKRTILIKSVALLLLIVWSSGCASYLARKRLEGVAKGWCQTIRASQVIPVYPLTEDLVVGDVFLVQTPISTQASAYEAKGFLPLDDSQVRLGYTNFSKMYFSGYFKDAFGATPHELPTFTNNGVFHSTNPVLFTDAPLPRAAFPTYSFQAKSGFGFNAAFPIQGIPVALSYLNSQDVNGSVTIADARTYGGDNGQLLALLKEWAGDSTNKARLGETARNAFPTKIFLRVVSRIYFARSIDVSLQRSGSQGGGGKGGVVNDVSLLASNGTVNQDYTNVLNSLSSMATSVTNAGQVGAAVKFVAASGSTVGLSQSFDRLLAIGYLGFDVGVNTNGDLGAPIPTFQHLTGQIPTPPSPPVKFGDDTNTSKIRVWLHSPVSPATPPTPTHLEQLNNWLATLGIANIGITDVLNGAQYTAIRQSIVTKFNIQ